MEPVSSKEQALMRKNAESRLRDGTAPAGRATPPAGVEALALLHRLASARETSGDALKLLHELQVHQVELELMNEQADADRQELNEALQRHTAWFEFLPCACLALGDDGMLQAVNRSAAAWLAGAADPSTGARSPAAWVGHLLPDLLAPECRPQLRDMLRQLGAGAAQAQGRLRLLNDTADVDARATLPPGGHIALLALMPGDGGR